MEMLANFQYMLHIVKYSPNHIDTAKQHNRIYSGRSHSS